VTMPGGAEIASADAPVISGARQWPAATRQEYAAERTGPIYCLLHIPKTAGQTIQVHLAEHCAPGVFWQSQRRLRPGRRASAQDFPDIDRARVISGHHIGRSLERYFPGREVRRIVLLRDPLQMQLSFYNWKMMDHLAKGWGTYSFSLHLRALPRNFMTHFLLSRWVELSQPKLMAMSDTRKYQILNRALAGFWFVGAHSDCDRVIAAIGADLRVPPMAAPRNTSAEAQAHTGWRLVTAQSLSPSMRAAIRAKNPLDYALWESWGAAGFEPAKVRPAALSAQRSTTGLAHELVRPWFRLRRFVRREWVGRRPPSTGPVDRANSARDAGDWELAARHYRDALRVIPKASAIWVQYGHALKELGLVAEAEQAYRRSLQLNPDNADTHLQLGHALKLQQRFGEAANAYLAAARLDPTFGHARDELIGLGWPAQRIAGAVRASEPEPEITAAGSGAG
jgi:tetratricopeptide (TPR) repeat protein